MKICVREILETVIDVPNIETAKEMYDNSKIVLYPEDIKGVEFIEVGDN